jgi:SAM-dependent methyltransferase
MLKSLLDAVMERRARRLLEQVAMWLPDKGSVLDLGSGTGHFSALLERELGLEVVAADVSDMHVVGRPPVMIADGVLPFEERTFSAALLFFVLAYPNDPAGVLKEAARVTRGPVIVVQTLYSGRLGYAWHRCRELLWTIVAFRVSKLVGYVPPNAAPGSVGGRARDSGAARAAGVAESLPRGGRMGPGAQWLSAVSRS